MDNLFVFALVFMIAGGLVAAGLFIIAYTANRKALADDREEQDFFGRK